METPPAGEERASNDPAAVATTDTSSATVVAAPPADLDSSRPPCRFFLLGKCKFGDSCSFSHRPRGRLPVCRFFEKTGSCRYGKDCKFLHGSPAEAATTNADSGGGESVTGVSSGAAVAGAKGAKGGEHERRLDAGDHCGICLENIPASGKRFGLLNCDHVYCLECLRTWRKSKGPQKEISRTCPECRKVSFFLVPSKEHLKGKEKLKAIQAYKKGLSKLPCKYHKSDGSTVCPFGARCFYAHFDENGANVKDRPPPPQPASARRTCPYARVAAMDGARGGRPGGGATGGAVLERLSRRDLHQILRDFYSFEDEDL